MADIAEAARLASARLDHFDKRGAELGASIAEWGATHPVRLVSSIADDRLSWEARWELDAPPLESWALIFSDAAHHLRASLDNVLHYIAKQEGASLAQLRQVQFPIVEESSRWRDELRRIAMLPPQVCAAVEARQPFHYDADRRVNDPLWLLATFNNTDKHRVILVSTLEPRSISHQFKVRFEDEATDQAPRVEMFATVQNGRLAVRHDTSPDRIQDVAGSADCVMQVAVVDGAGVPRGITSCLAAIGSHVQVVLGEVLGAWAGVA